jgi:hypothetical protein
MQALDPHSEAAPSTAVVTEGPPATRAIALAGGPEAGGIWMHNDTLTAGASNVAQDQEALISRASARPPCELWHGEVRDLEKQLRARASTSRWSTASSARR